jgi:hypothetical protein
VFVLNVQLPLYFPEEITKQPVMLTAGLPPEYLKSKASQACWQYCTGTSVIPGIKEEGIIREEEEMEEEEEEEEEEELEEEEKLAKERIYLLLTLLIDTISSLDLTI